MTEKYLLIVEGSKTEKNIFEHLFKSYGFNVIKCENKISKDFNFEIIESDLVKDNKNIIIIEGPNNRIHDILLNIYNEDPLNDIDNINIEVLFGYKPNDFKGIFWIYDVDHNIPNDINKMFSKFNDENGNGLLLLSSPCIEVLGEYENKELKLNHIREYKSILNVHYNKLGFNNVEEYIKNNINTLMLKYLNKNYLDFNDSNILNHPNEIIEYINKYNERNNEKHYVIYRYFSTVVYCVLAFILDLTIEIDNYNIVKEFLEKNL